MNYRVHAEYVRFAKCQSETRDHFLLSEINSMVRNTGAKYSVLFQLQYYDAVRFVIIDPMHNLFLGQAKPTLKAWKENDLIGKKDFELLQRRVNAVVPPPEIGRIPSKIATRFSGSYSRPVEELGMLLLTICIERNFTQRTL